MLELNSYDEPNILFESADKKSFKIFTIATSHERNFRIVKETPSGLFNYNFLVDLSSFSVNDPVVFEIPYIRSNFIDSRLPQSPPQLLTTSIGTEIEEGIYKLLYLSRSNDKEIPAKIEINRTYLIGAKEVRFLYYRLIDNHVYFTGYFGNNFLNEETLPNINPTLDFEIFQDGNIYYYVLKISSTPNIIISKNLSSMISDIYTSGNYQYTLEAPGNGITGFDFSVNLRIKNLTTNQYVNSININLSSNNTIQIISFTIVDNQYRFLMRNVDNIPTLEFRFFIDE